MDCHSILSVKLPSSFVIRYDIAVRVVFISVHHNYIHHT